MEDLAEAVAFSDPISAIFDLHRDLMSRTKRLKFALNYTFIVGLLVGGILATLLGAVIAVSVALGIVVLEIEFLLIAGLISLASLFAAYYSWQHLRFLNQYEFLAAAINRATNWQPHPKIPAGPNPATSLVEYLRSQDERVRKLLEKAPAQLSAPSKIRGRSGKTHVFDLTITEFGQPFLKRRYGIRVFVRVRPRLTEEDVVQMKEAVEDVLGDSSLTPIRAFIIQTDDPGFSDEFLEVLSKNWLEYSRDVGGAEWDWKSPIEVVALDPSGAYNLGSWYFG